LIFTAGLHFTAVRRCRGGTGRACWSSLNDPDGQPPGYYSA